MADLIAGHDRRAVRGICSLCCGAPLEKWRENVSLLQELVVKAAKMFFRAAPAQFG
jgi:hypothetical protein